MVEVTGKNSNPFLEELARLNRISTVSAYKLKNLQPHTFGRRGSATHLNSSLPMGSFACNDDAS